ncbi:MAG: M14 family metallocarboxypeptidase [Candidatus Eremiobacteraeota bacterium]|nr:M14 family metallocarboxypeptidase [Candidatus Eremiobacteraeota bacterium]
MVRALSPQRYQQVIDRLDEIGQRPGVRLDVIDVVRRSGYALPFFRVRTEQSVGTTICLSAGIHGDEPAGVEALLSFFERPQLPRAAITALPCINPIGYIANTRRTDVGIDLNRTFGQDGAPRETELARQALSGTRFQAGIDLHEDTEARGFYLYEHVRDGRAPIGERIVASVRATGLPISDAPTVEGRALVDGCVEPAEETLSPLVGFFSIYLFDRHSDHTLVPESPAILPMSARVAMHLAAIDSLLSSTT